MDNCLTSRHKITPKSIDQSYSVAMDLQDELANENTALWQVPNSFKMEDQSWKILIFVSFPGKSKT